MSKQSSMRRKKKQKARRKGTPNTSYARPATASNKKMQLVAKIVVITIALMLVIAFSADFVRPLI